MSPAERRWISPAECAALLGLSSKAVYSLISRAKIPACKIGRLIRIDKRQLEQNLEAQVGAVAGK